MDDRTAYAVAFFVPFILVTGAARMLMELPGTNTAAALLGAIVGVLVLAGTWLSVNGLGRPSRPGRRSIALGGAAAVLVFLAALPIPAGAAPGEPSQADRTCECLGQAITAEATPMMMDVDTRRYCYGIPHSCQPYSSDDWVPEQLRNRSR